MDIKGGEEGESEIFGESNMESYITTWKINSQWEFALRLRELKQGLCDKKGGIGREMGGRFGREGQGCTCG